MAEPRRLHFLTGYPGFIGRRLLEELLHADRRARVAALVLPRFEAEAREAVQALAETEASRVELLLGDVCDMHLGLSGSEYRDLVERVGQIYHLAGIRHLGVDRGTLERVNVEGTRNVIELAREAPGLSRLNHMSTVHVAGDRQGVIAEDELEEGQRFRNAYEDTKFRAEVLVRKAMADLPITIYRPATVVGDSHTGRIDRLDGPYYLALLLVTSPLRVPLPLPGSGSFPFNVVPVDYVVRAIVHLAKDPRAVGRTFHLVDPNPMSARKVYETIAQRAGKPMPRMGLPAPARLMMRLPLLEKLARPQRAAAEQVDQIAFYNSRNTTELLDGTEIRCPPLTSYLDKLLEQVEQHARKKREGPAAEDPLAPAEELGAAR
jgi:thioester reductase-like protein